MKLKRLHSRVLTHMRVYVRTYTLVRICVHILCRNFYAYVCIFILNSELVSK